MSSVRYTLSPRGYLKIFFHAAKHPHLPVNGVLLGRKLDSISVGNGTVEITDAIPLLHHWTSLSPMMEIGLDLVTRHASEQGLEVVGYYQACDRLDDSALAPVGERVAGKIREAFGDAVAFVIDGEKIGSEEHVALIPYLPQSSSSLSSWRPYTSTPSPFSSGSIFTLTTASGSASLPALAKTLVKDHKTHQAFCDFDDHLEDVSLGE
ncbi:UPF0172-domain-containing protein [Gymnopus androsaceus JB14]|uniref:UPF0172-domain-containing protein n=1 Tax=Gymnopus androsaceus JB14 TaxID=1447944 RepID=A0A6A4GRN5_9AGAR|nr:UPF0172-domain-containing protein [Gymnopus androsaceus JB14]